MKIYAEIISIGDELLAGYTINTNSAFIAQQLRNIGIKVKWVTTISDEHNEILHALSTANQRAAVVMVTGGLGPTPDDITKNSISTFFNAELIEHPQVLEDLEKLIATRGRSKRFFDLNRGQALVPKGAKVLHNAHGTAPGIVLNKEDSWFCFMPGAPKEMKSDYFLDFLKDNLTLAHIDTKILRTTGIAESMLHELVNGTLNSYPQFGVAFLPKPIGVDLRFRFNTSENKNKKSWENFVDKVRKDAKEFIFTEDERNLEQVIVELLTERKLTLAIIESFTGGLVQDWITNVPGSSLTFLGGFVTYSNEAKVSFADVAENSLKQFGAVSEQVAVEMVRGVQKKFASDCAVSTTGIAGPSGGGAEKPVGLCYIAVRSGQKEAVRKFRFGTDREINKMRGAITAFDMLRKLL
jgi:competence/damage-inducible protein CinA-like protein